MRRLQYGKSDAITHKPCVQILVLYIYIYRAVTCRILFTETALFQRPQQISLIFGVVQGCQIEATVGDSHQSWILPCSDILQTSDVDANSYPHRGTWRGEVDATPPRSF